MSAAELLERAQADGVFLVLVEGRLTWEADHQPPADLLAALIAHKVEIIEALSAANDPPAEAVEWLANVACLLECSPDYLLEHGFIDRYDLVEQCGTHPLFAVRLIRSHPNWSPPAADDPAIEQHDTGELQGIHSSAATASSDWLLARDKYYGHLFTCRLCYAPVGRYCATGADLRAQYSATPWGTP